MNIVYSPFLELNTDFKFLFNNIYKELIGIPTLFSIFDVLVYYIIYYIGVLKKFQYN